MYGYIIAAVVLVAALGGAYIQGRTDGASHTQVQWDKAILAANELTETQRKADQDKSKKLAQRYESKIATQQQTNRQIADALQRELQKTPFSADCAIPDGVRVNVWNAANRGESIAAGELPAASTTTPGAPGKQP